MQPAGYALKDMPGQASQQQSPTPPPLRLRKGKTRAACISIINNQDLDRASRFRPPAPPAIKTQPSSAQCIFAAQAHPDTQLLLQKPAIYPHTHRSSQTNHCCAQRLASASPNMTCHPPSDICKLCLFVTDRNSNPNSVPVGALPNLTSHLLYPGLWNSSSRLQVCVASYISNIPS